MRDLGFYYMQVEDQVIDTLLYKYLINPALSDSIEFTFNHEHDSTDLIHFRGKRRVPAFDRSEFLNKATKRIIAFNLMTTEDSLIRNGKFKPSRRIIKEDAIKRSLKMIINRGNGGFDPNHHNKASFPFPVDTETFKKFYADSLAANDLNVKLFWYNESDSINKNQYGIVLDKGMYKDLPSVVVTGYSNHLLKEILPQILFALFLITLFASALTISYRGMKKQMELNVLRADFISNITHELKTPVSTAKVAIEALQRFDMSQDAKTTKKYLNMVAIEMERLDTLTSKVLNHSKFESQAGILKTEKINLSELVQSALKNMNNIIENSKGQVLFVGLEKDSFVEADPFYTELVIMNLIDNSLKYSSSNPVIKIEISETKNFVELSVSDNGPGIPEEYLTKVFDNFFRVPTGNKHNVNGYGLGLSFATMVVEQQNGNISVKNLEDKGCKFTLKFPKV